MFLETQPYYVEDFSGGITDFYLDAPQNRYKTANNLILEQYGKIAKPITRPGSAIWDLNNPQVPTGQNRISNFFLFKNIVFSGSYPTLTEHPFKLLLVQSGNHVFYIDTTDINFSAGNWVTIKGLSTGNDVYHTNTGVGNITSFAQWNDFVITTSDDGVTKPQKIYAVGYTNALTTQNAGLPRLGAGGFGAPFIEYSTNVFTGVGTPSSYLYAVHLETTFNIQSTSSTVKTFEDLGPPYQGIPSDPLQVILTSPIDTGETATVTASVASPTTITWTSHPGISGYGVVFTTTGTFPSGIDETTFGSRTSIPYFAFSTGANTFQISINMSGTPLINVTGAGSGTLTAHKRAVQIMETASFSPSANQNNYLASTRARIARTTANGSTFYYLDDPKSLAQTGVVPGSQFVDMVSDADLQTHEVMYTEGGVVERVEAPPSKFVHVVNDIAYYGYVWQTVSGTTSVNRSRLIQSIPGAPGSINETFTFDFKEELKGVSSFRGIPVAFCENSIYRIEGQFDELGRGGMFPQMISNEASCVNHNSIVQTNDGIFWAGKNGFFYTDGYKVFRVNDGWPNTYAVLVDSEQKKQRIVGREDSIRRRIYWTVTDDVQIDCSKIYVLDLNFGLSNDMPFTSISGGINGSFSPTAIEFDGENWYRGDRRGYIFYHQKSLFADPKVDVTKAVADWGRDAIVHTFVSGATNFGMSFTRYWVPRMVTQFKNVTNLSLQILSNNDDGRIVSELKPIKFRGNVVWGDPNVIWSDPTIFWNLSGFIERMRRFPAKGLRCSFKQIEMTNAFIAIANSDLLGMGTVDNTLKTVTLVNSFSSWPLDSANNFYIAFKNDNYVREYLIVERTAHTVTYIDAGNHSPNGLSEWVVRGIPLDEFLAMQSYTIYYAPLGKTQQAFRAAEGGEPADA